MIEPLTYLRINAGPQSGVYVQARELAAILDRNVTDRHSAKYLSEELEKLAERVEAGEGDGGLELWRP